MRNRPISKIFIANRGEIAHRVIRTASKMGISTVVPVIKDEEHSLPALTADEVHILQSTVLNETYLDAEFMVKLALQYGADAIHPGYGFLSENFAFAEMVEKSGLTWIGPAPSSIKDMGNKLTARRLAEKAGISVTKALTGSPSEIVHNRNTLNYPLLIKAAAGGGGKGMKIARHENELSQLLNEASREALSYFGDDTVYVEEYIEDPHHIEVQILGDHHGNIIHLFERECSIQRRYQKIIEEAPSPFVNSRLRDKLVTDAILLGRQIGYYNAGTIEFLVDKSGKYYFLEMNTRLQVEHPVTESITDIDLVEQQIKIATGLPLSISQNDIKIRGHAIEARVYAENALADFNPSPGKIHHVKWPDSKIARTDTYFSSNTEIQSSFDPMLAKIIAKKDTRKETINQLARSLSQTSAMGIPTNLPYLRELLQTDAFISGNTTTHFTSNHHNKLVEAIHPNGTEKTKLLLAAYSVWLTKHRESINKTIWTKLGHKRWNNLYEVTLNDQQYLLKILHTNKPSSISLCINHQKIESIQNIQFSENYMRFIFQNKWHQLFWYADKRELLLGIDGHTYRLTPGFFLRNISSVKTADDATDNQVTAPIPGKISKILISEGNIIKKNTPILILEAMKMENTIYAPVDGILQKIFVMEGDQVKAGQLLIIIDKELIEIEK